MFQAVRDWFSGKPYCSRAAGWPKLRKEHLLKQPRCQVCGKTDALEVHHILPVHVFPQLELDPDNLLTLCEAGATNHHLFVGHLGNYCSWNPEAVADAETWWRKIRNRP